VSCRTACEETLVSLNNLTHLEEKVYRMYTCKCYCTFSDVTYDNIKYHLKTVQIKLNYVYYSIDQKVGNFIQY